jgi:hypothetical protein
VGDNWETVQRQLHYVDYTLVAAIVVALVWWLVRRRAAASARAESS